MKKIIIVLAALSLLLTAMSAQAAKLITTPGTVAPDSALLQRAVYPVRVNDGLAGEPISESTNLWALTDNKPETSYSFLGWASVREKGLDALIFDFDNAQIDSIWMRSGDQSSEEAYYAHARPSTVKVTIVCADGMQYQLQYQMEDRYDPDTRYGDWYDGYQQLPLDRTYTNVVSVRMFINWFAGSVRDTTNYVHVSDVLFTGEEAYAYPGSQPGWNTPQAAQHYGLANTTLATRSGPGTQYDELGSYALKGQYVRVVTAAWDQRNEIWWLQVEANEGAGKLRRFYTGLKRIDEIDVADLPQEDMLAEAMVTGNAVCYYGPGSGYELRSVSLPIGLSGAVYNYENGFFQFEFSPNNNGQLMRVWVPDYALALY